MSTHRVTKILKSVNYRMEYKMEIEFNGNESRTVNLSALVTKRPQWAFLRDVKAFCNPEITEEGGIRWVQSKNSIVGVSGPTLYHMAEVPPPSFGS